MGQDAANPQAGAQSLGELGDAFGDVEKKATTKESRKAARADNGRFQAASDDTGDDEHDDDGDDEEAKPGKKKGKPEPKGDDDDGDTGDDGDDGDDTQHAAGDDDGGDDDDGEEHDDDDGAEKYTLKVNGEKRTLTRAEMLEAASKGLSAHDRWEKAATTQKQADNLIHAVNQQRQQLNTMLQNVQTHIRALMQSETPNLDELAQTDPAAWVRQKHLMEQRQQHLRDAEAAQAYLANQQAQLHEAQKGQFLEIQKDSVLEAIPAWRDPEKASRGIARINTLLSDAGFNAQEISEIGDARIVRVLHAAAINADKARKYDELKSKAGTAQKRVRDLPPVSERPGNRQPAQNQKADQRKRAVSQWEKNPNLDNLARLF
jgi:hypothetical protein